MNTNEWKWICARLTEYKTIITLPVRSVFVNYVINSSRMICHPLSPPPARPARPATLVVNLRRIWRTIYIFRVERFSVMSCGNIWGLAFPRGISMALSSVFPVCLPERRVFLFDICEFSGRRALLFTANWFYFQNIPARFSIRDSWNFHALPGAKIATAGKMCFCPRKIKIIARRSRFLQFRNVFSHIIKLRNSELYRSKGSRRTRRCRSRPRTIPGNVQKLHINNSKTRNLIVLRPFVPRVTLIPAGKKWTLKIKQKCYFPGI